MEFKVENGGVYRVYDETGVSWREAKKQLRQYYLDMAASVRSMRKSDVLSNDTGEIVINNEVSVAD